MRPDPALSPPPRYPGLYVDGSIAGLEVSFTVDTGATHTILASRVYDQLPPQLRPTLVKGGSCPSAADGRRLNHRGSAIFELCLGNLALRKKIEVADIADDVLLGADVLVYGPDGPADLILSEGQMRLAGISIPLRQVEASPGTFRVRTADCYIVPGMSEMLLDAYVDRPNPEVLKQCSPLVVEAAPGLIRRHTLAVAPTLVDAATQVTIKVRVMNPTRTPVSLRQDEVVGQAAEITGESTLVCSVEDECEIGNVKTIRRLMPAGERGSLVRSLPFKQVPDDPPAEVPSHLTEVFQQACEGHDDREKAEIGQLLRDHQEVFSRNELDLGVTNLLEHAIDTGRAPPIKQRPRRVPLAFAGEDQEAIRKLVDQGSVRPSTSPWASPLVLVRKRDGTVRPCVDYRAVNAVTVKDAFPLPRTEDCLDAVAGASIFSTLDITSAYNQIPVREEDIPKTAFVTRHGLFEYRTMAFGLTNAPATFQRAMEIALSGLQWTTCLIYLDDVIVFGRTFEEHKQRLADVLRHIHKAGLKLKPSKCQLFRPRVQFLGHIVSGEGIQPDPGNIAKVSNWPVPRHATDVRAFLGLGNYYRRFVRDFSKRVRPLVKLTKKDCPFKWTEECQSAFDEIKACLVGAEVLGYPMDSAPFVLDTDASEHSIGAVLSQVQDGRERVIAYGSRTLCKAERNYCVTDRELLAVKVFVEHYKHYLLGRRFTVRSDHQALKWLFSLREPKDRVARWIEALSAYDFSIEYRPGNRHGNADALSRCPDPRNCACPDEGAALRCGPCRKCQRRANLSPQPEATTGYSDVSDTRRVTTRSQAKEKEDHPPKAPSKTTPTTVAEATGGQTPSKLLSRGSPDTLPATDTEGPPPMATHPPAATAHTEPPGTAQNHPEWRSKYSAANLRQKQKADADLAPLFEWLNRTGGPNPEEVAAAAPATRHYWVQHRLLTIKDGVIYRQFTKKNGTWTGWQFLVPRSLRSEVFQMGHDTALAGHLGQKKTRERILRGFYWHGLREDVNCWVMQCDTCGQLKPPTHPPGKVIGAMPVGGPLDRLATDVLGPLPETKQGNRYILVVTDHFTKWVEIFAIPDQTAATCADRILNDVIARFGCPYDMHSDQGRNYESHIFQELCRLLEIRKTRTSVCNPRCNGQSERFNRTLVRMIKAYLCGEQTEWDRNLGCLAAAYRATPNESTALTPNLLMLGREVRLPAEVIFGSGTELHNQQVTSYGDYVDQLRSRMQRAHEVTREHLGQRARRQTQDGRQPPKTYSPGDLVWYLTEMGQVAITPKLRVPYKGPVLVLRQVTPLNYIIQLDEKGTQRLIRHDKLKPYEGTQVVPWAKSALTKYQKRRPQRMPGAGQGKGGGQEITN